MNELTLEVLAPYLTYGLKILIPAYPAKKNPFIKSEPETIVEMGCITMTGILYRETGGKPILRPLSDLCWSVTLNNETFVPVEFFEIGDSDNISLEFDYGNIKLINNLEEIAKHNIYNDIKYLPNYVVNKLFEWHFDVFGLIPKGLSIDINTLK